MAFSIGVMDMVGRGQTLISATSHALEVYISLSVVYYVIVIVLEKGFALAERRLQRHERKSTMPKPAVRAERLKRIAG
ncbi:L-cystine transport system permease protein TcyL [compost metagenome]